MEKILERLDDAIAASLGGEVVIRGEVLINDIRARAGREPAELFFAIYARAERARVRVDIQTPKGRLRVGLDGGISVRHPSGNWLLPVEVDEQQGVLRARESILEVLEATLASPEEVEITASPI